MICAPGDVALGSGHLCNPLRGGASGAEFSLASREDLLDDFDRLDSGTQMAGGEFSCGFGVMAAICVQQTVMDCIAVSHLGRPCLERCADVDRRSISKNSQDRFEPRRYSGCQQHCVKAAVEVDESSDVVLVVYLGQEGARGPEILLADAVYCLPGRRWFEEEANLVDLAHFVEGRCVDYGPSVAVEVDEPFRCQVPHGLPDGRGADPEGFGQLGLDEPCAPLKIAPHDGLPHGFPDGFVRRARPEIVKNQRDRASFLTRPTFRLLACSTGSYCNVRHSCFSPGMSVDTARPSSHTVSYII